MRRSHAVLVVLALLLAALGVCAWFGLGGPAQDAPARVVQARTDAVAVAAQSTGDAGTARESVSAANAAGSEPLFLCTFLDGAPVPSLVEDVRTVARHLPDWTAAIPRHRVTATGDALAVIARDCIAAVVRRGELPSHGEHRVDLTRSPVLDVRLVNVPAGIRERLDLQLQLDYGQLEEAENAASCATDLRRPIRMDEDRVLVPLVVRRPGRVVVHATSRHSTHSFPTSKVPFEPVSQVIEIDCGVLGPACELADLSLTLRFPYAHPAGSFDLSIQDGAGSNMMFQRRERTDAKELRYVFRDLPRETVHAVVQLEVRKHTLPIHLEPIDLSGGSREVVRDVVAESSLRVVLTGREGLAEDGVSVLLRRERGESFVANWPRGAETRFEHLTAGPVYAQVIAYDGQRCSRIVRVDVGTAQAHELALQLVPAGAVEVVAGAFGAATSHLDLLYPEHGTSRIFLCNGKARPFWLPIGEPRVEWTGGSRTLRVDGGVINRWP